MAWIEDKHEHVNITSVVKVANDFYQMQQQVTKRNYFLVVSEQDDKIRYHHFKAIDEATADAVFANKENLVYGLFDATFGEAS